MTYVPYYHDGHALKGRLIRSAARPYDCVTGEDEACPVASPIGVSREAEASGLLDFPDMDDAASLNLVPWMDLPRRARHRNEQARLFRQ
jgi:hypothetical protein